MGSSFSVFLIDIWSVVPYYTSRLYAGLRRAKVDVVLASMTYDLDPQCFSRAGIPNDPGLLDVVGRRRVRNPRLRKSLKSVEGLINLLALTVRFLFSRPDILHIHHIHFSRTGVQLQWWFLKYAQRLGIRLVYTVHNVLPHENGDRYRQSFAQLYRTVDALICHSEAIKTRLIREFDIHEPRIRVVPHGPLFDNFTGTNSSQTKNRWAKEGAYLVVCQGIIRPYKGMPFLLDTWSEVEKVNPRASLIIAGLAEPQYARNLKERAERLGLTRVQFEFRFLETDEMLELLKAADVLVYPYQEITTSGALMTGITQSKPIVATDLPPFRQTLCDEQNAVLVPYGDVSGMARALLAFAENLETQQQLADRREVSTQREDPWISIGQATQTCYEWVLTGRVHDT